jgi:S-adenosylmethionine-diacylglycerol 3-amino-3-carboxypropyl transferase
MASDASARRDFHPLRYGQCWEDADILLEALDIRPGHVCLSIASGGDNTLALLSRRPDRVIALDLSPAQIACLELRVAAYRELCHAELLELIGSLPSSRRQDHYRRCRSQLSTDTRAFWDTHPETIALGIGGAGKFERYLAIFRTHVLPLAHPRERTLRLLRAMSRDERESFYEGRWDTWRWRLLFRLFFSRHLMCRLGRDPAFFRYVRGSVAEEILGHTRHALTALNPSENPYLQWILTGRHLTALPCALRPENFEVIRAHLDRLEWHCCSLERFLETRKKHSIDRFNLSDVFEYVSPHNYSRLLERLVHAGRSGGRLAYWNMLVHRCRPPEMAERLRPLTGLAWRLHAEDKAFFYRAFVVEEIV